tara:strand:- start:335 stop:1261 length:927 start_codon:yes stop_codon:yes gene_type:complete
MRYLSLVLLIFFNLSQFTKEGYSGENKILFKINNEIITSLDIASEIKYLGTINKDYTRLEKIKAIEIAKKSLIREKIKEIELLKIFKELKIDEKFLNKFAINYFTRLGINSMYEFDNFFSNQGLDPTSVKNKITMEILWNQLIYNKFIENVKIDKELIKKDLLTNSKQKEFLLSEILFNLNNEEKLNEKFKIIKKDIYEKSFSEAALTHSISASNNNGGKLGWVKESVLGSKIKIQLSKIKKGDITNPITIPGGFLLIKIEDVRTIKKSINLEEEMELIINKKTNEQLNQFSNVYFNKIKKNITINEL